MGGKGCSTSVPTYPGPHMGTPKPLLVLPSQKLWVPVASFEEGKGAGFGGREWQEHGRGQSIPLTPELQDFCCTNQVLSPPEDESSLPVHQACQFGQEPYFCGAQLPQEDGEVTLPQRSNLAGWPPGQWSMSLRQVLPPRALLWGQGKSHKGCHVPIPQPTLQTQETSGKWWPRTSHKRPHLWEGTGGCWPSPERVPGEVAAQRR